MFGRSKPVVFERYGKRRRRTAVPRWLLLLSFGVVLGAGGVVLVQERYMAPRLSAEASTKLRAAFDKDEAEVLRLTRDLAATRQRLDAAAADQQRLSGELAAGRDATERLRSDVAAAVDALPPDPRGGPVAVRAARFATKSSGQGRALSYEVVLSRERPGDKPFTGVMRLAVEGTSARGDTATVPLKPVAISVGSHDVLRGSLALPDGFKPKQTTVVVLDRIDGKQFGMRVIAVE